MTAIKFLLGLNFVTTFALAANLSNSIYIVKMELNDSVIESVKRCNINKDELNLFKFKLNDRLENIEDRLIFITQITTNK
jgi:hypothetical protein